MYEQRLRRLEKQLPLRPFNPVAFVSSEQETEQLQQTKKLHSKTIVFIEDIPEEERA